MTVFSEQSLYVKHVLELGTFFIYTILFGSLKVTIVAHIL